MNTFATLLILFLGATANNSDRFVEFVNRHRNNATSNWHAELSTRFDYNNQHQLLSVLGVSGEILKKNKHFNKFDGSQPETANVSQANKLLTASLPTSLDLRAKYPKCWSIGYIRDQAGCGSCWAVSSMTSLSDRYCIKNSNATTLVQRSFSYEDLLECCNNTVCGSGGNGCNGGYMTGGYSYAQKVGVSSGENYNNYTSCKPYFLQPGTSASNAPACRSVCTNTATYKTAYAKDLVKITGYTILAGSTPAIASSNMIAALNAAGSIMVYMDVYEDFFTYSSGVYEYTSGAYAGGHAIRIIGYGVANGVNYWLAANSWGVSWGMAGFFQIQRGVNMVNIESYPIQANL